VEVRRSGVHGRGVFACAAIRGRRRIGLVGGRLVTLPQARRAVEQRDMIFLVELDATCALDCSRGNAFGHLNHSCRPNCYLRIWKRTVEVYPLRAIAPGEELTVDYGVTPHRGGMACRCGAPGCRKII
jgi:SET domain-containing protein